ncbi:ribose-phosphate pyrophosphokinase [Sulfobacillus acidophilus TPY]|jgi:ribose-phosphate pyrophosphokinase|uniref:Ribose-phosphate pyrophosphokinase n=1 Tax=Sulfobacillus acidophilus (strain ATCC 700253 / DSM 10332 / NAL) TaxID=679936 RepID=G8TWA3_SULAD|nr:ribose-phosphate pyrophosphokinase [Sulfobacillus acidophilus TPY]AEW03746.1 ribose-phosphate pyrophosphokinase [Sulfobacillus acidophilus DSM 10332]MCY0865789.1 ribose-phosphate pyrophosphokinase [Sulfobacillus sp.]
MFEREGVLKIFTGNANRPLAEKIVEHLGIKLGDADVGRFSNGEIRVRLLENVRGSDVFIVQPTSGPVNDNLMELLLLIDATRRASARRVTAVVPFYGYARQDRKERGREPISAKLVANLITTAGAKRVLTMDLHAPQIQGFFDIPVDNLQGGRILAQAIAARQLENLMIFSPDAGGVNRARQLAKFLGAPLGFIDKRRPEPNVSEVVNVIGKVRDRSVVIVDDMIDTGGTIAKAAQAIMDLGAKAVYAAATHPVFSGHAAEILRHSPIQEILVTDTIPLTEPMDRTTVISVAPLLAEAIMRVHEDLSVSKLFE